MAHWKVIKAYYRAISENVNLGSQAAVFFAGNLVGNRVALGLFQSPEKYHLSGFSAGVAALEGYNMAVCKPHPGEIYTWALSTVVRLSLNSLCFMLDGSQREEMIIKNFAFYAQVGGLMFGWTLGELSNRRRIKKQAENQGMNNN